MPKSRKSRYLLFYKCMKKIILVCLIPILWVVSSFASHHEDEHLNRSYYSCKHCCQVIATSDRPRTNGCSAQSGYGYHSWNEIGEVGQDAYGCGHCSITVYVNGRPRTGGCCSNAGYGYHSWNKY